MICGNFYLFREYSALEILMKALPFKDVMQEIRKAYRRKNNLQKEHQYLFTSKKMRRMEDLYQLRDRDLEAIEEVAAQVKPKRHYSKEYETPLSVFLGATFFWF